ncbi:MAG: Arginine-binding extracellular protein ArtP [Chlamydiae bacterium]|nr:Arginine-binding extracellular protein ArtP [Chlamydiota bacterium]
MGNKCIFCFLLLFALFSCDGKRTPSTYEIGIDPSWYPLQVPGQEKNILAFSIELLTTIAKKEDLQLAVMQRNWDNLLWGLRAEKYPAALSTMRPYTFYQKEYSFSQAYLMTGPVLVVPKNAKAKNIDDMQGKEMGVVRGSSAALLLQTVPGVMLQGYDSIATTLEALDQQQVDGAVIEVLMAQDYVRNLYADTLKVVGLPMSDEGLRLVSLFHYAPQLMERFDKGLMKMKKSGEYDNLLTKWGLSPDGKPIADLNHEAESFLKKFL